ASGDTIQVGDRGHAEVLLNPGYFLRLSSNSRVRLVDLSPDNLKIKLLAGSAIVEIAIDHFNVKMKLNETLFDLVTIVTSRDEYVITKGGAYRFDVKAVDADSDVKVLKGLVIVSGSKVMDGMMATVRDGRVTLA